MTTGVPLPEPRWSACNPETCEVSESVYTADQMREYAAAECAPLINEIEALRQDGSRFFAELRRLHEVNQELLNALKLTEAGLADIANNKPDQPVINYIMLHTFATEHKVSYNELCRVVRAATTQPGSEA